MPVAEGLFERIESSLVAAACGDALGWITEMNQYPDSLRHLFGVERLADFQDWGKSARAGGGRRYLDRVRRGEYSDDTQLTLAVFRSLRGDGSFDGDHFTGRELAIMKARIPPRRSSRNRPGRTPISPNSPIAWLWMNYPRRTGYSTPFSEPEQSPK